MTLDTLTATPADDFGTTPLTAVYTVFVDDPETGEPVDAWRSVSRYTASALANYATDLGYRVSTDLWADDGSRYAPILDAMISPAVWEGYRLASLPRVHRPLLVCTRCLDVRPDADQIGQGVSLGASCVFYDCDGTYTDPC